MKAKKGMTRILAIVLVLMMFFSTVEISSFRTFAAEDVKSESSEEVVSDDVENEDDTLEESEENSEEVSSERNEENSEEASSEGNEENSEEASSEGTEENSEEASSEGNEENSEEASSEGAEKNSEEASSEEDNENSEEVSLESGKEATEEESFETSEENPEDGSEIIQEDICATGLDDFGSCVDGYLYLECIDMGINDVPNYIEDALEYWYGTESAFDNMSIQLPQTDGRCIITKEVLNAVYKNIHNPKAAQVVYYFHELGEEGYRWYFYKLKEAKEDFCAELSIEETEINGLLKFSFAKSSIVPAESAYIYRCGDSGNSAFYEFLTSALGVPHSEEIYCYPMDESLNAIDDRRSVSLSVTKNFYDFWLSYYESYDGTRWKDAYFAKAVWQGEIDDKNPVTLSCVDSGVSDVHFRVVEPDSYLMEIKDGKLSVKNTKNYGCFGQVLCTYKNAAQEKCVETWVYKTVAGIDKIVFDESEVEFVWNGYSEIENTLQFSTNPIEQKSWIRRDEFTWEVEDIKNSPIELVSKSAKSDFSDEYYSYYDGTYKVKGYGEARVKVSYRGKEAVCTVKIVEQMRVPDISGTFVSGLVGIDATLADLDINNVINYHYPNFKGHLIWEDPTIKLEQKMGYEAFYTVYYVEDGKKSDPLSLRVIMHDFEKFSVSGLDQYGYVTTLPSRIKSGTNLKMALDMSLGYDSSYMTIQKYIDKGKMKVVWKDGKEMSEYNGSTKAFIPRVFTAGSKGKKTFTAEIINTKTNKVIKSDTKTIQIHEKELFDFDAMTVNIVSDPSDKMKGVIKFELSKANYSNAGESLKVKIMDTSVVKLGKQNVLESDTADCLIIEIPYTLKKKERTSFSVTANDECKSNKAYVIGVLDYSPVLLTEEVILDKAFSGEARVNFYYPEGSEGLSINLKDDYDGQKFFWDWRERRISAIDFSNLEKGKYKVVFEVTYKANGREQIVDLPLNINVKHTKGLIKVKQITPVNEFYSYDGDDILAELKITSKDVVINSAHVIDEELPFYIQKVDYEGTFVLRLEYDATLSELTEEQKKIEIYVDYFNVDSERVYGTETVSIKLKTNKKAPKIEFFNSKPIFNTTIELTDCYMGVKNGDEDISLETGFYVYDEKTKQEKLVRGVDTYMNHTSEDIFTVGKNRYYITAIGDVFCAELVSPENAVAGTDVLKYRLQMPNWKESVNGKMSLVVQTKPAQFELTNKTLTLNMNKEIYRDMSVETSVKFKNNSSLVDNIRILEYVKITGVDAKTKKALQNNLEVVQNGDSEIRARIVDLGNDKNGTKLKAGTYKVSITAWIDNSSQKFTLTIKVVDKAPSKMVSFKQKGSIDVLDRKFSYITLDYDFNMDLGPGTLEDIKLEGKDAKMFDICFEDYECQIRAKQYCDYYLSKTYEVYPILLWRTNDNKLIKIQGSLQKIKVKQSKVTYKITQTEPNAPLIYRDSVLSLRFETFDKEGYCLHAREVKLLNYTNDIKEYWPDSNELMLDFNSVPVGIKKSSGIYTLKFAVTPQNAALDSKPMTLTYKVKIIR